MSARRVLTGLALASSVGVISFVGCGGGGGHGGASSASTASTASGSSSATPTGSTSGTSGGTSTAVTVATGAATGYTPRTKTAKVIARSGEGFLEDQNGYRILHVKGSAYDRGVQYGELVGDQIEHNFQVMDTLARTQQTTLPPSLVPLLTIAGAQIYKSHFPQESLEMIRGICEGARHRTPQVSIREEQLIFLNAIIDIGATVQVPMFKCSGFAAWGPRTVGGKMYQHRNVDLFVGTGLEDSAMFVVEKPDNGKTFVNLGWAGMIGLASGMNEHGIAISQVWAFSNDSGIGQPWIITNRRVMTELENVDGVWGIYSTTKRTYGSNFVFADRGDGRGGKPRAITLDSTWKMLAQFGDDDPSEDAVWNGIPLAIRLPFAVMRGDQSMSKAIHDRHYHVNGQSDPRDKGGYKSRYKQQADLAEDYRQKGVLIGVNEMKAIASQVAMRNDSLQCGVYENTDLVAHVANSKQAGGGAWAQAHSEPYHACDLDYYLPTASVGTDKGAFSAGDSVTVTTTVKNNGRTRKLEARAYLEVAGSRIPLGGAVKVEALTGKPVTLSNKVTVPPSVPAGLGRVAVELVEAGTTDTVDYGSVAVSVR